MIFISFKNLNSNKFNKHKDSPKNGQNAKSVGNDFLRSIPAILFFFIGLFVPKRPAVCGTIYIKQVGLYKPLRRM